jgi:hypothetical protein
MEYTPLRGPDEPTAYDLARASLGRAELDAWIRQWWLHRYVPEEVLGKMGLLETKEPLLYKV